MHDPLTQAFQIKYPWKDKPTQFSPKGYRHTFITIWHKDPEKDGSDDSCGWFKRARHGDKAVLSEIASMFKSEWDSEYGGWFDKDGNPKYSVISIVLNMVRRAAYFHFGKDWDRTQKFVSRNLYDILFFAENPIDSLHPSVTQKYGKKKDRDRRIEEFSSIIYGWVIRQDQKWYQHARWHVWHWQFQVHPWQSLKRRFWDKCDRCKKRGFAKGVSAIGDWSGKRIWHDTCDESRAAVNASKG